VSQQPHVQAFAGLLTGPQPSLVVYYGEAPAGAVMPYVILHPSMPLGSTETLDGSVAFSGNDVQTTCVGATVEQAQWLAANVGARVDRKRVVIDGKDHGLVRHEFSQPAREDRDVTPTVFYAVDGWSFTTN